MVEMGRGAGLDEKVVQHRVQQIAAFGERRDKEVVLSLWKLGVLLSWKKEHNTVFDSGSR